MNQSFRLPGESSQKESKHEFPHNKLTDRRDHRISQISQSTGQEPTVRRKNLAPPFNVPNKYKVLFLRPLQ